MKAQRGQSYGARRETSPDVSTSGTQPYHHLTAVFCENPEDWQTGADGSTRTERPTRPLRASHHRTPRYVAGGLEKLRMWRWIYAIPVCGSAQDITVTVVLRQQARRVGEAHIADEILDLVNQVAKRAPKPLDLGGKYIGDSPYGLHSREHEGKDITDTTNVGIVVSKTPLGCYRSSHGITHFKAFPIEPPASMPSTGLTSTPRTPTTS